MNLRNKPVDKRRLTAQDRSSYRGGSGQQALSRARAHRGAMGWNNKVTMGTQEHTPGSGGFTMGRRAQHLRLREEGAKVQRSEQLKPDTSIYMNDIYQR